MIQQNNKILPTKNQLITFLKTQYASRSDDKFFQGLFYILDVYQRKFHLPMVSSERNEKHVRFMEILAMEWLYFNSHTENHIKPFLDIMDIIAYLENNIRVLFEFVKKHGNNPLNWPKSPELLDHVINGHYVLYDLPQDLFKIN